MWQDKIIHEATYARFSPMASEATYARFRPMASLHIVYNMIVDQRSPRMTVGSSTLRATELSIMGCFRDMSGSGPASKVRLAAVAQVCPEQHNMFPENCTVGLSKVARYACPSTDSGIATASARLQGSQTPTTSPCVQ